MGIATENILSAAMVSTGFTLTDSWIKTAVACASCDCGTLAFDI
jgi:hypothetical protein